MRSTKQLAIVLALGAALPLWAGQHNGAPQHSSPPPQHSAPPPQHQSAPHQPAYRPQNQGSHAPMYPTQHSYSTPNQGQGPRAQQPSHAPVPRPPESTQHQVPHPPESQPGNPMVGNVQSSVPRPPTIGTPRDVHKESVPHSGDWLRRYSAMPEQQRQHALENDPNFKRLTPQQQQTYKSQLNQFNNKSPEQQQKIINRMDAWGHLSPQQQQQARTTYGQLKSMPADRQQQVNSAYKRLRAMPPSARQQVMNSPEFQSRYTEQERSVIKSMTDINSSLPHQP